MVEKPLNIAQSVNCLLQQHLANSVEDAECADYSGCSFILSHHSIKFRKAKITPKKEGVFTSLWKRNSEGKTVSFDENDPFDFYIIMAESTLNKGYFVFPSQILSQHGILSCNNANGRRGFRLYPSWSFPQNKQARKTQEWQLEYFLEESESERFKELILK